MNTDLHPHDSFHSSHQGGAAFSPPHAAVEDQQTQQLHRDQLCALLRAENSYLVDYVPCTAVPPGASAGDNKGIGAGAAKGGAGNGGFGSSPTRVPLDEWRRKICQWSFRVIDHFRLDREIVSVGMNLLDRFLVSYVPPSYCTNGGNVGNSKLAPPSLSLLTQPRCYCPGCKRSFDSQTYQLAAMTCVYIAIKIHVDNGSDEDYTRRKHFQVGTFAELSRGMFDVGDICALEETVLHALRWKLSVPTPMTFVNYLLTLMPGRDMIPTISRNRYDLVVHVVRELSRYLTELAVSLGSECMYYKPSHVAFASILVSMDLLTFQALPQPVRDTFTGRVYRLGFCDKPGLIDGIRHRLQKTLWPDMLLEDTDGTDPGHPISMARECGILNINHIYPVSSYRPLSPPETPQQGNKGLLSGRSPTQQQGGRYTWEASGSPVGVER